MPSASFTPKITHALAERHEALWLRLNALHKDICAMAAKKPEAPVGETERILAEGLLSDIRPFLAGRKKEALPVAAPLLAGLAVQLGQMLAKLDDFENRHAAWDARQNCRCWCVDGEPFPVARLRQSVAIAPLTTSRGENIRDKLWERIMAQRRQAFEAGFIAGRNARLGPPERSDDRAAFALAEKTYPRGTPSEI